MHSALTSTLADSAQFQLRALGRIPTASNATFLVETVGQDPPRRGVWKPVAGERPLWDFPDGTLAARETAAYRLSAAAGFDVVPATVLVDTPNGAGALQSWVDVDASLAGLVDLVPLGEVPEGWFGVVDGLDATGEEITLVHADDPRLRRIALFDVVTNNSDRKGAHLLPSDGAVLGCDHGLCFHVEPKLRTILWGWAGAPLEEEDIALLGNVADLAERELADLLAPEEVLAVVERTARLLVEGVFPEPSQDWPAIPWPPL